MLDDDIAAMQRTMTTFKSALRAAGPLVAASDSRSAGSSRAANALAPMLASISKGHPAVGASESAGVDVLRKEIRGSAGTAASARLAAQIGGVSSAAAAMKGFGSRGYVPPGIMGAHREGLPSILRDSMAGSNMGNLSSAVEALKAATDRYSTRGAVDSVRAAMADAMPLIEPVLGPPPVIRNHTADLVRLQRDAEDRREEERAAEEEHREQSLTVQRAMYDALLESERARAADADASAERERAALERAEAAELRADVRDKREAFMVRMTKVSVAVAILSMLAAVAAVVVSIILAS